MKNSGSLRLKTDRRERFYMERRGKCAILTAICALAFGGGLLAGYVNDKKEVSLHEKEPLQESMKTAETVREKETPDFRIPEPTEKRIAYYEIRLSGDYIVVFEVYTDNTKSEIERAEIESDMLLHHDRKMLEDGINVSDFDDAMLIVEDFVS